MSRRLRRDLHKRISSAGYEKIHGDLDVTGEIIGPTITDIVTAIGVLTSGTTTPVQLTITRCEGAYKSIILQWLVQYNLVNFDRYEIQVSADGATWYSLEFDGTDWKDALDGDTDWVAPMLVHIPIPFTGTAAAPTGRLLYYRMRQVTITGDASAWSATVSATTSTVQTGDVAANAIDANKITTATLQALFAKVSYALTIGFGGTGTEGTPDDGDRRTYIDEDDFKQQIANADGEWETRLSAGRRTGSDVFDLFVSGFSKSGESTLSSPGLIWEESTIPFTAASHIHRIAVGNDVLVAVGSNAEIARSTDNGNGWGALIGNPFLAAVIHGLGYGNSVWIAGGELGRIARSTDDGVTWGALIGNPFGASTVRQIVYAGTAHIAVANDGKIARSTDGGVTWGSLISNPFGTDHITNVAYDGSGVVIAVAANGEMARSIDDGLTWGSLITNPFGVSTIYGIHFDNTVWVATGNQGKIARSTDGGVTWGSLISNPFGGATTIWCVSCGGDVWIAGAASGKIARSTDGGLTWGAQVYGDAEVSQPFGATALFDAVLFNDGRWFIGGNLAGPGAIIAISDYLEAGAGIVEQGSNPNGEYVIFSNGLQVCLSYKSASQAVTGAWGNIFIGPEQTPGTMPAAFASAPYQLATSYRDSDALSVANLISVNRKPTTTAWGRFQLVRGTAVTATFGCTLVAIGWAG